MQSSILKIEILCMISTERIKIANTKKSLRRFQFIRTGRKKMNSTSAPNVFITSCLIDNEALKFVNIYISNTVHICESCRCLFLQRFYYDNNDRFEFSKFCNNLVYSWSEKINFIISYHDSFRY